MTLILKNGGVTEIAFDFSLKSKLVGGNYLGLTRDFVGISRSRVMSFGIFILGLCNILLTEILFLLIL